jgi:ATP-dependent Clp protease adaptor protein ClpS
MFHYISYMEDTKTHKLVLYNDDSISFPYVMACLIKLCNYEPNQAEQCALIAHDRGECIIKHGTFDAMFDLLHNFENLEIKVELKEYEGNLYR